MESLSGIIYPPPEVKIIVDKTADFVARNGKEFETRIRAHEKDNPKFKFLLKENPYNAYYEMKIEESKRKLSEPAPAPAEPKAEEQPIPDDE
jgi:splicing factor 3A subunit 1